MKKQTDPRICFGGVEKIADPENLTCLGLARMRGASYADSASAMEVHLDTLSQDITLKVSRKKLPKGIRTMGWNEIGEFKVANYILALNGYFFADVSLCPKSSTSLEGNLYREDKFRG